METQHFWKDAITCSQVLGKLAVTALVDEAELTPKPALVDKENSGAHTDLNIDVMICSARSLRDTFIEIGKSAFLKKPSRILRDEIAIIGQNGEKVMLKATGGTNTHKGAIWALGLLTAGAAMNKSGSSSAIIAKTAGEIARFENTLGVEKLSNGLRVARKYGVKGAKGEAQAGFPHVIDIGLPALYKARNLGISETYAKLDTLITLMAYVDDTCLLHRGGMEALIAAQNGAKAILAVGGTSTKAGFNALRSLDESLIILNSSPGGSADLLAATLFLDSLKNINQLN